MPKRAKKQVVDERASQRKLVNAALRTAEASATALLRDRVSAAGVITSDDVVTVLQGMGGVWPTQCRPNVAPDTKVPDVPGMCLGLAPDRSYAGCAIGKVSKDCPELSKLVTAWARASIPDPSFKFGACQINFNYRARKHIDMNNLGPSYITSLGDHSGGELWTGDQGVLDCGQGKWKLFDGNTAHMTMPFQGQERFSFILFTPDAYNQLLPSITREAHRLGFMAASSDGTDDPYFAQFRDLGKVDERQFDKLMASRQDDSPPPSGSGSVGVECNGYAAGRGSGWVSFQAATPESSSSSSSSSPSLSSGVQVLRFAKNKTGLHVVELEANCEEPPTALQAKRRKKAAAAECPKRGEPKTGRGAAAHDDDDDDEEGGGGGGDEKAPLTFRLLGSQTFNLYKDTEKETRRWCSWVRSRPVGRVVAVCITDTAMAKTRPLSKDVYDALRLLGAPLSLTLIGYREPFAFVGVKGLSDGGAAVAQDAKKQSKTLLRIEATLARTRRGATTAAGVGVGGGCLPPLYVACTRVGEVKLLGALEDLKESGGATGKSGGSGGDSEDEGGEGNGSGGGGGSPAEITKPFKDKSLQGVKRARCDA